MRCQALVYDHSLEIRSRFSPADPYCLRNGKVLIHGRRYCEQHAPIWREKWACHEQIKKRILAIPPRSDIL